MKRLLFCVIGLVTFIGLASDASALPRFSLLTGTRCSACHVNPQGSGLRTELGWQMMNETGLLQWQRKASVETSDDPFAELEASADTTPSAEPEIPTNTLYDGLLIPGLDTRLQWVKLSTTGERKIIPMQLTPYLAIVPSHELSIYGAFNLGAVLYKLRKKDVTIDSKTVRVSVNSTYPGQADYEAAVQYQPHYSLPGIRVGMIQPSIGIRHDDHTVFTRREVGLFGSNLMPPNYNDVGAELTYEGMPWLTINAGIFNAYHLSQAEGSIGTVENMFDFAQPTVSARVMLWPQLLDNGINGEFGASILKNGDFHMINVFGGFGLADKATFFVEGVYSRNANDRIVRNISVIGSYQIYPWLAANWRYEWAQTELYKSIDLGHAQAFVAGLEFFPFPFIELRPEYRVFERVPFAQAAKRDASYTVQLHLFY